MSAPIEMQQDGQRPEVPGPVHDPWLRYRDTGLHVLPYRHHAIEFAALPFLAGIRQFDKVCLELPAWMPVERVRKAIADVAPGVGALLIPSGDPVPMLVQEYVGDPHPAVRIVSPSALLPIAPDAMLNVPSDCHEPPLVCWFLLTFVLPDE